MKQFLRVWLVGVIVCALGYVATAQTMGQPEQFTSNVVDMNNGRAGQIVIDVDRWSTMADRSKFTTALFDEHQDELLRSFQDARSVGRIRTPDSIGYDLKYAQQRPGRDGGRDIVLVTDRPISFWEAANRPRSINYPFTLIQIHMNQNGKGEGKLAVATKITADPDTHMIEIEDFANQPAQLLDVRGTPKH